jgi:lipid-A-disaccharide synthase-like uncharacterized protein
LLENSKIMKTDKFVLILLFRLYYLSSLCGNLYLMYYAVTHGSLTLLGRLCIVLFAVSNLWLIAMNYKLNHEKEAGKRASNFQESDFKDE